MDALVSDDTDHAFGQAWAAGLGRFSTGTPPVPPGLGFIQFQSRPSTPQTPAMATLARPVIPVMPRPVTPLRPTSAAPGDQSADSVLTAPASEAKKSIKALAAKSGLSKDIASQASRPGKSKQVLEDEDFPALDAVKSGASLAKTPAVPAPPNVASGKATTAISKKDKGKEKDKAWEAEKEKAKAVAKLVAEPASTALAEPDAPKSAKRPTPGILNIAVATAAAQAKPADAQSAVEKPAVDHPSFPALPTPTTSSVSSPLARTAPKTLRLVPTPKVEVPQQTFSGAIAGPPSVRSIATSSQRPGTPASEIISEDASIASASVSASRASSPAPSTRIGSVAVRMTTKSQQRKARKEATKEAALFAAQSVKSAEPEVIAPIVGRKTKQKKDKSRSSSATPIQSRPGTPASQAGRDEAAALEPVEEVEPVVGEKSPRKGKGKAAAAREPRGKGKEKEVADSPPLSPQKPETPVVESPKKAMEKLPNPASTLQDLIDAGLLADPERLTFLKPVTPVSQRHEHGQNVSKDVMAPCKSIVTEEDQAHLLAGQAVRKIIDDMRVLLTPNGDCIRNLTPEEEERFLELQALIAASADDPATFTHPRHEAAGGFSLIKGRAVPNGPPGYFPQARNTYPTDPVNKIQREEAIYYINQYVLPRLNLGTTNLGFPGSWKSAFPDGKTNAASAAAGWNSLAPWLHSQGMNLSHDPVAPHTADLGGHGHHPMDNFGPSMDVVAHEHEHVLPAAAGKPAVAMPNNAYGNLPLMSLEDAEQALMLARKETEKLEKSLNQVIKKNRRILLLAGGAH